MKRLGLFVAMMLLMVGLFAQAPEKMTYQAVVRDNNQLVANANVGVRISVLQGSVTGSPVFIETHVASTNANGLMTLIIGEGTVVSGDFSAIDWGNGPYFLKTETDPTGGSNYTIEGTQQLMSVPYALYAKNAGNSFSGDYNDLTNKPNLSNVATSGNYNDLSNTPTIPTVPSNVSAFTNDAGYITSAAVPTNVSQLNNDANYITANDVPAQVNSDWNATGGTAQILNKPNLSAVATSGNYNDLSNKPNIPTVPTNVSAFTNDRGYITAGSIPTNVSAFANDRGYITAADIPAQVNSDWNATSGSAQILNKPNLSPVATSGNYNDLNNKPNLSNVATSGNYNDLSNTPNLSNVATSGSYNDLSNTPTIPRVPTNVSEFNNDAGYITTAAIPTQVSAFNNDAGYITSAAVPTNVSQLNNDANYITANDVPAQVNSDWNATSGSAQILNKPNLSPVATSGNYNDLNNKPNLSNVATSGNYNDLSNTPNLSNVATSGNYNDLSNTPTIPRVPTNVSEFTNDANYITSAAIPTQVSAFNNDAGYLTSYTEQQILTISNDTIYLTGGSFVKLPAGFDGDYNSLTNKPNLFSGNYNDLTNKPDLFSGNYNDLNNKPNLANVATSGNYNDLSNTPTIPRVPTNVSEFTNDAGYITISDVPSRVNADWNATEGSAQILNKPNLSTVATSGDYNDLSNTPTIPTVPGNVSAFTNDAGYITISDVPSRVNADWNATEGAAQILNKPTNVSAFNNDRGYLTSYTEQQILTISNDTIYLTGGSFVKLPAGFDGDYNSLTNKPNLANVATSGNYNDLSNTPTIPTVPTNVSAFNNDANYITSAAIPTQVSAFNNDAGYITSAAVPTNVSQLNNDANYITANDIPEQVNADWNATEGAAQILNKPTNVSAFNNDRGYLTSYTEQQILTMSNDTIYLTGGSFVKLPAGFDGDYNSLTNKPNLFSGDYNDLNNKPNLANVATSGNYNDLSNTPTIPTVPSNVSEFNNDAGYITSSAVPTNVSQLNNDANYITSAAIPTNVSEFTNDAGYITSAAVPTNVSQLNNDANYITSAAIPAYQVLSISNDTIYLTNGGYVKLPAGFSGDYNDLTNKPTIPVIPENVSTFNNDARYLTKDSLNAYNMSPDDIQNMLNRIAALELQLSLPVLNTTSIDSINSTSAVSGGCVVSSPTAVTERGVCWNTTGTPTVADSHTSDGNGIGNFVSSLTSLTPATTYYVRAYAVNGVGTGYGPQISFTTFDVPGVTTDLISYITSTSAVVSCSVSDNHGANVTEQGICWNTTGMPTISDNTQTASLENANYAISMSALTPATTYYVRAYAVNSEGTGYGNMLTFVTSNDVPYVTTAEISVVNATSATGGGNVTSSNGSAITARGVCWRTSENPTIADSHTTDGTGTGSFTSNLTGLTANTTYYVRAYATNSVGTAYGSAETFTTSASSLDAQPCPGAATVTDVDGNIYNTVKIGNQCWMKENLRTTKYADGTSVSLGSSESTTTAYRYCPNNDSSNVAIYGYLYNWKAVMGNYFSSNNNPSGVQGICPNGWHVPSDAEWTQLTNYVKSQSQYLCGSYNNYIAKALSSTTGWDSQPYTCAVGNNLSGNNATGFSTVPAGSYGNHGRNFGYNAYFWSATQNDASTAYSRSFYDYDPTVNRNNLNKHIGYSVRCLRDEGSSPTTSLPTVSTTAVSGITQTTATSGGNVISDGGQTVTARGVCWSTSQYPTISDSHTTDGTGTGAFSSNLAGLTANTTYYVRAYATNSVGVAYGSVETFTTSTASLDGQPCPNAATLTDVDGNVYNTVQIGQQCWMKENLRTTKYADGTSISLGSSLSATTAYRYYPNNSSGNVSTYGYLYNWPAVMHNSSSSDSNPSGVQGICPNGWHVPSDAEWTQLTNYVSSQSQYVCESTSTNIAKALASTTGWNSSTNTCVVGNNPGTNNATGFSAVPAGHYGGSYNGFGCIAYFWSATQQLAASCAYGRYLAHWYAYVTYNGGDKILGFSVRCLRNEGGSPTTSLPTVSTTAVSDITHTTATSGGNVTSDGGANVTSRGVCWSTSENPTIADSYTTNGIGTGSFTSSMTGLTANTTYYVRAYATNSVGTAYGAQQSFTTTAASFNCGTATVSDYDGNVYNTVQIGQQCWMKENLRTTQYADGTSISLGSSTSTTTAYRYYPNNSSGNVSTYGYLYNWPAVMRNSSSSNSNPSGVQGICPTGWHVPSDAEWTQLTNYVSSQSEYLCGSNSSYIAKSLASTTGWNSNSATCVVGNNPGTNNATGFSAVPAGSYNYRFGYSAYFWSSTKYVSGYAYYRDLGFGNAKVEKYDYNMDGCISVRCLRD